MITINSKCLTALFLAVCLIPSAFAQENPMQFLSNANAKVARAAAVKNRWEGPIDSPKLQKKKKIIFIGGDMSDAGTAAVLNGVREASAAGGWETLFIDCRGRCNQGAAIITQAIGMKADGIILAGVDAGTQSKGLAAAANAKVPVLVEKNQNGVDFVLTESAAILMYLAEKHNAFLPQHPIQKARVIEQLFFHASGVSPAFGNAGYFQKLAPEKIPAAIERFHNEAMRVTQLLNDVLAQNDYVAANEFTIADIAHFGWFWRSAFVGIDLSNYPNVQRWFDLISNRPAVKTAIQKLEGLVKSA